MTSAPPLHSDDVAAVHLTAGPDGTPAVMIAGHAPVDRAAFEPWAHALRDLSAREAGVATVRHAGVDGTGRPVLVVDAAGTTLAEYLVGRGPLPPAEVHRVGVALSAALAAAHAAGLPHGAVCPSTVLIGTDGTPMLAGFDTCAPGLGKPGVARTEDVSALAATLLTALGPDERAPELAAALRTAAGLAAANAPGGRAADLAGALAALPVPALTGAQPLAALSATDVGASVRPVNDAVVSINLAVAGAAAAGMAVTAGMVTGQAVPGLLAQAGAGGLSSAASSSSAAMGAATSTASTSSAAKVGALTAKTIGGLTAGKVGAAVVGLVVVAGAATAGIVAINSEGGQPEGPGPLTEEIKAFDFANTTFSDPAVGIEATLVDGRSPTQSTEIGDIVYRLGDDPIVYADADGDRDLDAMVVLAQENPNNLFEWVYVWEWKDGAAHMLPYPVADAGRCGNDFEPPAGGEESFQLTRLMAVDVPDCASPRRADETVSIGIRDGYPVAVAPAYGAAASCTPIDGYTTMEISGIEPLIVPTDGAPTVGEPGEFTTVEVVYIEFSEYDEWLQARLTRTDGTVSCGFVKGDDVFG